MKALILLIPFVLLSGILYAQENWLRKDGGLSNDEALDMTSTTEGAFLITGYFNSTCSFGDLNLTSAGFSDIFLHKVDAEGFTIWAKKFGGAFSDRAVAIASDEVGNSYITGFFTESASFGGTVINQVGDSLEIFIAKIDPGGTVLWVKGCGGISDDFAHGIDVDPMGNVLVTGQFKGLAHFGPFELQSLDYEGSNDPSYDVFITKLDSNGNFLWAKKGSAAEDDRGLDISSDSEGNVYVCGQFSDTITFDNIHYNDVMNAGFLLRYSPSGDEEWFTTFSASQVLCYDVMCDSDDHIVITGDYIGQMGISGNSFELIPFEYLYNVFVIKFDNTGDVIWTSHAGSDSEVSAKACDEGSLGEYYITGTFKCRFDELSEIHGEGIFNSAGYRDVFVMRFNADGTRIWEKQYGGPKDDFCQGIAAGTTENMPLIAGSFSVFFNVPSHESFNFYTTDNFNAIVHYSPTCSAYCGDVWYSQYITVASNGNRDIFFTSPVNLSREHYDIYNRSHPGPPCELDVIAPCVDQNYNDQFCMSWQDNFCQDTIVVCGTGANLHANENTGTPSFIGPGYEYIWNTGSTQSQINVESSGWYSAEVTREDQCWSFMDSIYVTLVPPQCPTITDSEGVNIEAACFTWPVSACDPDTITLDGGNIFSDIYWWGNWVVGTVEDSILQVTEDGLYFFQETDSMGCTWGTSIYVNFHSVLDTISPYLEVSSNWEIVNDYDSLVVCENQWDFVNYDILDYLGSPNSLFAENVSANWNVNYEGSYLASCDTCNHSYTLIPSATGWYEVTAEPMLIPTAPCEGLEVYPVLIHHVYISIEPSPSTYVWITGSPFLCPGDTTLLVAHGAESYNWMGNELAAVLSEDSVLVSENGGYYVTGTNVLGSCSSEDVAGISISNYDAAEIEVIPSNGIVCPGDSVLLICEEGLAYQWVGPLGELIDTTQSIWVNTPGYYFCIQTNFDACPVESNFVEVKEYNTPYLLVEPGVDLCVSESVTLYVITNDNEAITWAPPLTGGGPIETVYEPGIYTVSAELCGVTTSQSVEIIMSEIPAEITSMQQVICDGDSITLYANAGLNGYYWQPGGIPLESITVGDPGWYILTTFDELGCTGVDSLLLYSEEQVLPLAQDTIVCSGQIVQLNATSPLPVYWASDAEGNNVLSVDLTLITPPVIANTVFYVLSTDQSCGNLVNDVNVGIFGSSIPPVIEADGSICSGGNFVLASPGTDSLLYTWTLPDGTIINAEEINIMDADETVQGWYYLQASDTNCISAETSFFVDIPPIETLEIISDGDFVLCEGETMSLESPVLAETYTWTFPGNINTDGQIIEIVSISPEDAGTYSLEVTGADCDYLFYEINIEVIEIPVFSLDSLSVYCNDGYYTAFLPAGYDEYLWSTGEVTPEIIVPSNGWLWAQITEYPDCAVRDSVWIDNIDCLEDFVNIFSPNNDGYNDEVDFNMLRIPLEEVKIYNRWGNLVRRLENPFVWNGKTDDGQNLLPGTYYYVAISPQTREHFNHVEGTIFLIRGED